MLSPLYKNEEMRAARKMTIEAITSRLVKELKKLREYEEAKNELREFLNTHQCKTTCEYESKFQPKDDDPFWEIKDKYEEVVLMC